MKLTFLVAIASAACGYAAAYFVHRDGSFAPPGGSSTVPAQQLAASSASSSKVENAASAGVTLLQSQAEEGAAISVAAQPGKPNQKLLDAMMATLSDSMEAVRDRRWYTLIELMRPEDAESVRDLFKQQDAQGRAFSELFSHFWRKWGDVDPKAAWTYIQSNPGDARASGWVFKYWAKKNPAEAMAALDAGGTTEAQNSAAIGFMHGLSEIDLPAATKFALERLNPEVDINVGSRVAWSAVFSQGVRAAEDWYRQLPQNAPDSFKGSAFSVMLTATSRGNGEALSDFAERFATDPMLQSDENADRLFRNLREKGAAPWKAMAALAQAKPENAATYARFAVNYQGREQAEEWLKANPDHPAAFAVKTACGGPPPE